MEDAYVPRSPDLSALTYEAPPAPHQQPPPSRQTSIYTPPADLSTPGQGFPDFSLPAQSAPAPQSYQWPPPQQDTPLAPHFQHQPSYPLASTSANTAQTIIPASGEVPPRPRRGRPPKSGSGSSKDPEWTPGGEKHGSHVQFPAQSWHGASGMSQPLPNKQEDEDEDEQKPAPGAEENIVVRTKFPVARLKRIVQADEDVGKVAQSTPVAVSKALELFMISMMLNSGSEARAKGSKRITGLHLKHAVSKDEQFDFLSDQVERIQDGPGGVKEKSGPGAGHTGGSASEDVDAMDEDNGAGGKVKKTRIGGRRRRKVESDEDEF